MGDQNGVVIVPREIAATCWSGCASARAAEADYTAAVARGRVLEPVGRHDARSERPHPRRLKCRELTDRRPRCWEGSRTRSRLLAASPAGVDRSLAVRGMDAPVRHWRWCAAFQRLKGATSRP